MMHSIQKIGTYWEHIPGYQDRQSCRACRRVETMEHILINCNEPPPRIIWQLAKNIWPEHTYEWPEISIGIILGCGSITSPREEAHLRVDQAEQDRRTRNTKGATRLMQITVTESAHLIWVLRCERVIRGVTHSNKEIKARWLQAINTRLTDDKITATRIKRDKRFKKLVKTTWEPPLRKQGELPDDWLNNREVLVGRRTQRTPQG